MKKCPICNKELKQLMSHLRKHFTSDKERYEFYLKQYYNVSLNDIIDKYKTGEESPYTIYLKYNIDMRKYLYSFLRRTPSESKKTIGYKKKYNQTIKKKYGVDHISQSPKIKIKKKQTFIKNYGVENNFSRPEIHAKAILSNINRTKEQKKESHKKYIETLHQKYGPSINNVTQLPHVSKKLSQKVKERLKNMSDDDKINMTQKARHIKVKNGPISKIEKVVSNILKKYNKKYMHNKGMGKYICDFIDQEQKKIIEINGDLWHANPIKYQPNDIIPVINKLAQQIWERDKKRKDYFTKLGYEYIIIWENEIHKKPEEHIINLLKEKNVL